MRVLLGKVQAVMGDVVDPLVCVCARESEVNMTDTGMSVVADMAARHPSLEELHVDGEPCTVCVRTACGMVGRMCD